uniref:Uncharacterized protein n=1 Tax=Peronospora matthiolae TaxID=2874970 RepID=A0AAV1T6W5_9STRA
MDDARARWQKETNELGFVKECGSSVLTGYVRHTIRANGYERQPIHSTVDA